MVTHDQEEALTMADKVVCMNAGRIEQIGSPHEIYSSPRSRFVADFVGVSNLLEAAAVGALLPDLLQRQPVDGSHLLALRPEDIRLRKVDKAEAQVTGITFLGNISRIAVRWRDTDLVAEMHRHFDIAVGDSVVMEVDATAGSWVKA
jgi:iron(III) transport system ATP-binding protein